MADADLRWIRRGEVGGANRVYADHVLDGLAELSDEDLQRQRWLVGPASLSEAWEQVFDDSGLSFVLDRPDAARLLTRDLAAAFHALNQALRDVDQDRPAEQIIDDPSLTKVRTAATRALVLVREQLAGWPSRLRSVRLATGEDAIGFMVERVPELDRLREESVRDNEELLPYVAFGSYFMPWFRERVEARDRPSALRFLGAVETLLVEGQAEAENLAFIEFAEWIAHDDLLEVVEPWLGRMTAAAVTRVRKGP